MVLGDVGACHSKEVDWGQRLLPWSVHTFPQHFLSYMKPQLNPPPLDVPIVSFVKKKIKG